MVQLLWAQNRIYFVRCNCTLPGIGDYSSAGFNTVQVDLPGRCKLRFILVLGVMVLILILLVLQSIVSKVVSCITSYDQVSVDFEELQSNVSHQPHLLVGLLERLTVKASHTLHDSIKVSSRPPLVNVRVTVSSFGLSVLQRNIRPLIWLLVGNAASRGILAEWQLAGFMLETAGLQLAGFIMARFSRTPWRGRVSC